MKFFILITFITITTLFVETFFNESHSSYSHTEHDTQACADTMNCCPLVQVICHNGQCAYQG